MKIAIVGGCGHYRYVLQELKNHTLLGVAPGIIGENLDKLQAALAKAGIEAEVFYDWKKLVKNADVVVVNTRPDKNAIVSTYCLERGARVFSEKPLAVTMEQLETLGAAAEKSKGHVSAMLGIRYSGWYRTVKKALPEIGDIRLINAQKSYKLGQRPDFYKNKSTFGGIIPWVAIHALDWILDLTGAKVTAIGADTNNDHNNNHGDLEMTALCQLQLEGGILASVSADFLRPEGAPTHDDDRIRIVGTKGILEYMDGKVMLLNAQGSTQLPLEEGEDVFRLFLEDSGITEQDSFYVTELALNLNEAAEP
jgi:predicted dehydrogenase